LSHVFPLYVKLFLLSFSFISHSQFSRAGLTLSNLLLFNYTSSVNLAD
jgi:hypothetical protein